MKRSISQRLGLGAAVLFAFVFTAAVQAQDPPQVYGIVKSSSNGVPVARATVELKKGTDVLKQVFSNSKGQYLFFVSLSAGQYKVRVTYGKRSQTASVNYSGSPTRVDISLPD